MGKKSQVCTTLCGRQTQVGPRNAVLLWRCAPGSFPNAEVEGYEDSGEWEILLERVGDQSWLSASDLDGVQESRGDNSGSGVVCSEEKTSSCLARKQCENYAHVRSLRNIERGFWMDEMKPGDSA
jgi:hypothetical protein